MSRRAVLSIAVVCLLAPGRRRFAVDAVGRRTRGLGHVASRVRNTGIDLTVSGRSTFAVLPNPRIKFEQISLRQPSTSADGRRRDLAGGDRHPAAASGTGVTRERVAQRQPPQRLRVRTCGRGTGRACCGTPPGSASVDRLVIAGSSLRWTDRPEDGLDSINAVFAWSATTTCSSVAGSATVPWRNRERSKKRPCSRWRSPPDSAGRLALNATLHAAQFSVDGIAQAGADPRFKGKSLLKATSMRDFTRWSGLDLPFGSLLRAVSVEGLLSFDRRGLSWPSVEVKLGRDALEGTLAVQARRRTAADHRNARGGRCRSDRPRRCRSRRP